MNREDLVWALNARMAIEVGDPEGFTTPTRVEADYGETIVSELEQLIAERDAE